MAKRIKLENITEQRKPHEHLTLLLTGAIGFCPTCGENIIEEVITDEIVCSNCRCLLESDWEFCPICGEKVEESDLVEHYHKDKQIDNTEFKTKAKSLKRRAK